MGMPTKLDCRVPMPDTLNLEQFRGRGIQPGEKELPEESAEPPQSSPEADELQVAQLVSMDISQNAAKRAVLAADWLFSHADDLAGAVASLPSQQKDAQTTQDCVDGPGEYRLLGFISHVGKHTSHGHYVCHMRTPSGWVIYDDQKVAKSENPPT